MSALPGSRVLPLAGSAIRASRGTGSAPAAAARGGNTPWG
ncbi:hypothetical protein BJ992_003508 [Sphaerisporangium rubeum]|uniref:Uncharacterized protein n=1 Tax=Sphaerisporangium rubeum TaxID=321317 RepID=A0A7X0M7A2_9ACTN|nr:hypothetical protein [Sphaerisporangium rubeum]